MKTTFALVLVAAALRGQTAEPVPPGGALAGERPRVLVSSDIGGTDPDDFQSMVHLLLYADVLDLEGIVSSPYGPGRREHILQVIDLYEKDYPNLKAHAAGYPAPDALRAIAKQGAEKDPGAAGFAGPTEGSRWIIECARRPDPRPLHVLVWGGLEDLAQALHDDPGILPRLRVYFIGGPNKMWSVNAYNYIEQNHPKLWFIEANSTYRGWFVGGNQAAPWGNASFVAANVAGRGALGGFFASLLKGSMKMGDSPSVAWLLRGDAARPESAGWGGRFVRVWDGRKTRFTRAATAADMIELFGVAEFSLPLPEGMRKDAQVEVLLDGRVRTQARNDGRWLLFRFAPRDAKPWTYSLHSGGVKLDALAGRFTAAPPPTERTAKPSAAHPNWWTDDPSPAAAEGIHAGARHVSRRREQFLADFAARLERCRPAAR